jgi:hypothetical protein
MRVCATTETLRLARLRRHAFKPFQDLRTEAKHREDEQHEQRPEDAQKELPQFRLPCGRTDDSAAQAKLSIDELSPVNAGQPSWR